MSNEVLFEVKDMHVHYGTIHAIHGINLKVHKGEIVTILGSNGAGKTTTLHAISGLIPISQGEIIYDNHPIHQTKAHKIVSMGVAQSPEGRMVFPDLTILENLEMGAYLRRDKEKIQKEIDKGKWVALLFTLLTDAAAVTIGILARVYFTEYGDNPVAILGNGGENVLSMITEEFLPTILVAIYIAIVLSAIMSTIDSLLILASSAVTRDFYQKIFRPDLKDEDLTGFSRIITIAMALAALGIAILLYNLYPDRQVFWIMIFGWSGIAATFCPVIILSIFWKGYSEYGAIASMLTGFVSVIFFKFYVSNLEGIGKYFVELDVLAPSFAMAMIVGFIVSKIFPPKQYTEEVKV